MRCFVKDVSRLTIREFAADNHLLDLLFPKGIPDAIQSPMWDDCGEDEMSECQRSFFNRWGEQVPDLPLGEVVTWYDCIGFMDVGYAAKWLPVWMCASYFDQGRDDGRHGLVEQHSLFAIQRCLEAGRLFLPLESLMQFVSDLGDPPEVDPELHLLLDSFRGQVWSHD